MEKAIEAIGVTKVFGRFRDKVVAVNNLNMKIKKGTVHGFIGPNGAGKTTTIKMIVGAIKPTKGKIFVFGEPAGSVKAKSYLGYSPEHPDFYPMSAMDFLVYSAEVCGMKRDEARKRAKELLEWMGLYDFRNKNARNFSAGMKQKLSLIQALIHDPEIIILDEPTANLDPIGRLEILEKIRMLAVKEKKTIFVSSHILHELERIVDHVTIIKRGNVILQASVEEFRKKFMVNHFIINTKNNSKYLKEIKKIRYVKEAKINHEKKIETIVTNSQKFKKELLGLFRGKEEELIEFSPFKMSLENFFLKVMGREEWEL